MKKLFLLCFLMFAFPFVYGQASAGPFTFTSANSPCAVIDVTGMSTVGVGVSGTFAMTLQPGVAIRGQAASNAQATPSTSTTPQPTITATGNYSVGVAGMSTFQLCVTAYTSGTATVYLNAMKSVSLGFSGAGTTGSNFTGSVGTGNPVVGNSSGQLYSSGDTYFATAFCGTAGFGTYNLATLSCTGSYDNVHQIGHGACQAVIAALAVTTPLGTGKVDASGFGGTQFIDSNCAVTLTYAGAANAPGSTVNGRVQWATNVTFLVDGPTTLPFFTDGAVCAAAVCMVGAGTTSGPSTWGTPGFLLANQFTGMFGGSKDGTQFIPCATTVTGCVHDWPDRAFAVTSTTVAGNTMTITLAANTLIAGGQNNAGSNPSAPISGFSGTSGTLSFTNTGTNAFVAGFNAILFGFTAPNTALNGQTCTISATGLSTTTFQCAVTGSGYASGAGNISEANIYPQGGGLTGEYVHLVNSSLDNNNGTYLVKTVPTNNTLTVGIATGATSCAANCGTIHLGTAMVGWGMQVANMPYIPQQGGAGLQSFGQRLEDLAIWGEATQIAQGKVWPYGFIAMQNANAGENAGALHVQCDYIAFICLDLHGGATDSGPWNDLRMTNLSNNNAVRGTTPFAVSSPARGITNSSAITPYPTGAITTATGALGACAAFCAQVSGVNPATFATVLPNTQIVIAGSGCPGTICTVASVQNNTTLTLTSDPGAGGTTFIYGQPLACWMVDGQGPTVNQSPVFQANHPEGCADGYRMAGNYSVRGVTIQGFLGGPNGGHRDVNIVHAVAAGNQVLGSNVTGIDTQNGGATNTVLDDINVNSCLDLPLNNYSWDPSGVPYYSCKQGNFTTGTNLMNGYMHSLAATKTTSADSASITATTAATSTTIFTFNSFVANTTYKIHCSGTTTQATAGAGIGIAYQTATNATPVELHAQVANSPTTYSAQSSGLVSNTGANVIYLGASGTLTTQLPWVIDGSLAVGATIPTALNIGFYTANAADAVVVKQGSTCSLI